MKRFSTWLRLGVVFIMAGGCQEPKPEPGSADYRMDQAQRQIQRDIDARDAKARKPMDAHRRQGQDVIDQPIRPAR